MPYHDNLKKHFRISRYTICCDNPPKASPADLRSFRMRDGVAAPPEDAPRDVGNSG